MGSQNNINLTRQALANVDHYSDWTKGEFEFAKKLMNSKFTEQLFQVNGRKISNSWVQLDLINGDKRADFLVFTLEAIFVFEIKDVSEASEVLNLSSSDNAWKQCSTYVEITNDRITKLVPVVGIVIFANIEGSGHTLS